MLVVVWLSKIAASPFVANLLVPAIARALSSFFESHATIAEQRAANAEAKAASKIEDNQKRAEALRDASKKLSDITRNR